MEYQGNKLKKEKKKRNSNHDKINVTMTSKKVTLLFERKSYILAYQREGLLLAL